jgi:hypothetical protein
MEKTICLGNDAVVVTNISRLLKKVINNQVYADAHAIRSF